MSLKIKEQTNGLIDMAIGMPDGISLPFVIMTGTCAVSGDNEVITLAGLLAIAINALTMGVGAYYTNKTEARHFNTDLKIKEINERKFLSNLGISDDIQNMASGEILKEDQKWDELMQQRPSPARSLRNGVSKASACIIGGLIPALPFIIMKETWPALKLSIGLTLISLIVFGYIKGRFTSGSGTAAVVRTLLFTSIAAACVFGVAKIING